MVIPLAICLAVLPGQVAPSMVNTWTALTGSSTRILGIRGNHIVYASYHAIGAIDKLTGRIIWRHEPRDLVFGQPTLCGDRIIALRWNWAPISLVSIDASTGVIQKALSFPDGVKIASSDSRAFALHKDGRLVAYDKTLSRQLWETTVPGGPFDLNLTMTAVDGTLLMSVNKLGSFGYDEATGSKLWFRPAEYQTHRIVTGEGLAYFRGSEADVRDVRTGETVWKPGVNTEWVLFHKGLLFSEEGEDWIVARRVKTGEIVWRKQMGWLVGRGSEPAAIPSPDGESIWLRTEGMRSFSIAGELQWTLDSPLPSYVEEDQWIVIDYTRMMSYSPGKPTSVPLTPDAGRTLAERLVNDYENLDEKERDLLIQLAPHATGLLLKQFPAWAQEVRVGPWSDRKEVVRSMLFGVKDRLAKMVTASDTGQLMDTIEKVGPDNEWAGYLEHIFYEKADRAWPIPYFLNRIKSPNLRPSEFPPRIIARSTHPDAVAFMIRTLKNPSADINLRSLAFIHLAGTGGDAGARAVLAARPKRGPIQRWQKRVDMKALRPEEKLRTAKDKKGRTWMLFSSGILGYPGDLFIAPRQGKGWGEAVYIGTRTFYGDNGGVPNNDRGMTHSELLAGGWVKLFPTDPVIRMDKDKDGLTDLIEIMWRTNPSDRDSDDDGLIDSVDSCPLQAPRPLGDEEKIAAACLDAYFIRLRPAMRWPTLINVDSAVMPFELYSSGAPTFWTSYRGSPFDHEYGPGLFSFSSELSRFQWLELSADGKAATAWLVLGNREPSRFKASLVKFGNEWLTTSFEPFYL